MRESSRKYPVIRYRHTKGSPVDDIVAIEEPLEILINETPYYVTMRLPGEEMALALGFCFSEGLIDTLDDVLSVNYCGEETGNRVNVSLNPQRMAVQGFQLRPKRSISYSSCGICGKDMVSDLSGFFPGIEKSLKIEVSEIARLQEIVEGKQEVFHLTGATHAAGIFDSEGKLLSFSEDVGRHNGLDKAMGSLIFSKRIKDASIVVLSSRLSYEMVQKAARLGAEILVGASSATSLAVELARSVDLTLVGFSRKGQGNIYTCPERIAFGPG